jgi:surfactin synthase thioesterase subunit
LPPPSARGPDAPTRLIVLPFAGGGVGVYRTWQAALGDGVEVVPIHLPGRERRMAEKPHLSMDALLAELVPAVVGLADRPTAIFGHSMGAAIGWELALRLESVSRPLTRLIVSARRAPTTKPPMPPMFALSDARLIEETERRYGLLPAILRDHPALLATFLPTLRADLQLLETSRPSVDTITAPITAMWASQDHSTPLDAVTPWAERTHGTFEAVEVPGGHFWLRDDPVLAVAKVGAALGR